MHVRINMHFTLVCLKRFKMHLLRMNLILVFAGSVFIHIIQVMTIKQNGSSKALTVQTYYTLKLVASEFQIPFNSKSLLKTTQNKVKYAPK